MATSRGFSTCVCVCVCVCARVCMCACMCACTTKSHLISPPAVKKAPYTQQVFGNKLWLVVFTALLLDISVGFALSCGGSGGVGREIT